MSETRQFGTAAPGRPPRPVGFGGFRLEVDGTLYRGNEAVHLAPKELAALRMLIAHAGQVVSTEQLKRELWGELHVTADSVPRCLSSLRARLEPEVCIQTVYKRGYRFTAAIDRPDSGLGRAFPRLAIMPFSAGFGVPGHFGLAIADEVMARLTSAASPVAAIIARDSVFALARRGQSSQQIGEALRADLVLTGTLSRSPDQFRLRAEMVRVADGTQIWVEDVLVTHGQPGGLDSELARRVTARLGAQAPTATEVPASGTLDSPVRLDAYNLFLQGRYEWQTLKRHGMQAGAQHLLEASLLDPSLVRARIEMVHACVTQAILGYMAPEEAAEQVRHLVAAIPDLHGQAAELLPEIGWMRFHVERNLPAAVGAFSMSAHLPHDPWSIRARVMFALGRRRFDEAIELLRAELMADPYSPSIHGRLAWALHLAGRAEEGAAQARHALMVFPDHDAVVLYGAVVLAFNGDVQASLKIVEHLGKRSQNLDLAPSIEAYVLACAGRKEEARTILERLQWLGRERYVTRSFLPAALLAVGDEAMALKELRGANEARCPWFFQAVADPRLAPLHGNAEFQALEAILTGMELAGKGEL